MNRLKESLYSFLNKGNSRTVAIKKNIAGSLLLKCISILVSLQVVPLTIDYINPTRYGIWLTLSSIIAWLSYFDLGFAHGFRNRFAEAKALGDIKLAKEYVSTTYAVLLLMFSVIFVIAIIINQYLDWGSILNIDKMYNEELQLVFGILACFFCLNIVASVFTTMLTADQKPALASLIQTGGQVLAFICIYILTKTTSGNLTYLAFAFSGIPCFLLIAISIIMFSNKRYAEVAPSYRDVRLSLTKKIIGLGGQFFVIMISMLFIYQFINIILSRVHGPVVVTQYNIAYKYFNTLNMFFTILLTPFWSAFTDAFVKKEFMWMKNILSKLEKVYILFLPIVIIMLIVSDYLYELWIGESVEIPFSLSLWVALYISLLMGANTYMYLINGTSKVRLQLIVNVTFCVIAIPFMSLCSKYWGIGAVLFIPIIVLALLMIIGKIQISKIVENKAHGIWFK